MTDINTNNTPDEPDEEEVQYISCDMCRDDVPFDETTEWDTQGYSVVSGRRQRITRRLCESCNDVSSECSSCHEPTHNDDMCHVDSDPYTLICDACYSNCTSYCEDHDFSYFDHDSCPHCDDADERDGLIHSYSFRPNPMFRVTIKDKKSHLKTFTGFELEMEAVNCDVYDGARLANELFGDDTYLKHDGSLSNGFEMVSHPLAYDYAMDVFPWQKLKELADEGMRSASTRTCGLHIHINRNFFHSAPTVMYRFMSMFYNNADKWKAVAGRSESTYATWSDYELKAMLHYTRGFRTHAHNHERYVAINLQNSNTLELRFFKGTLRPETFIARIEAAHAVAHYAYATRNNVSIKSAHDWERFREWTIQNKYNAFDKYATLKGV